MVKKWITMISLLVILISSCVLETVYVNNSFNWIINSLETLQIELTENKEKCDIEELVNEAYNIHIEWDKKTKVLKCLIWHSGIKDVEIGMAKICVYVEENNYTEAYAEIASLIDYCSHYIDDFTISAQNIF